MYDLELSDKELKILQYVIEGRRKELKEELGIGPYELHGMMTRSEIFSCAFRKAREIYLTNAADELIELAHDQNLDPMRLRLKSDNTKWLLSKMMPAVYGDKVQVQIETVDLTGALEDARARAKIAQRTTDVVTDAVVKQVSHTESEEESDIFG